MPRGRLPRLDRPTRLEVHLPESIVSRVRLELFSEVENRVPQGDMSNLVGGLLTEWLKSRGVQI